MGVLGGRRQSAMMACVLLLAAASLVPSVALPQTTQGQRSVDFVIPAGALPDALTAFGVAANLQMLYPTDMAQGRRSPGVSGRLNPEEALRQLLAGTGLTFRFTAVDTVTLERLPAASSGVTTLDPVTVSGDNPVPPQAMIDNLPPAYAGGQVATGGQLGLLGNRDFQDVPFNITAYTSKLMQDQQARSIADVVANDSSVRNAWAAVSYTAPLMVRGFAVSNQDLAFGGLYGVAPALTVSPEFLERVEVLRGPGALLNGIAPQGSIGGNINLVPKRATDAPVTSLTLNYYSESQVGAHVDIGRRFGKDNAFGVRFDGVYRGGSTPVDRQRQEIGAAVLGLDYRGDRFRLSLDAGYQQQLYNAPSRPTYVNAGVPVPTAPSGTSNWFQSWTYANTRDTYGVVRGEYDLTENWTAYAAMGGRRNDMDAVTGFATVLNAQANINDAPLNFPLYVRSNTQEIGLRGRLATGPVRHDLSISGNRLQLENGQLNPTVRTIASNLYHPVLVPRPVYAALNPPRTGATQLKSLAIADTLSAFDDRAQLTLGLRQQQVRVHNYAAATGLRTTAYSEGALTPAVALLVKPWHNVSLYANYIQGLQPGQVAPATARNAGQVFKPFVSTQYEAGAKIDFGGFSSSLSLFQIEQDSGFVNPATMTYAVDGRQRNRGVELNGFGEPLPGVRLLGGVTLIDGELVATAGGINNGKTATAVPRVQVNLGGEWDLPFAPGLTASARAVHTGSQYLDVANTQSIPSWTRIDIGARYTFDGPGGRPVTIRANIENLFDRNYWASAGANFGLALGQPRTFLASTTFTF